MTSASVLDRPAAVANPYLEGNYAPVEVETTAFDLPVTGRIPEELEGRFLRIGPNPKDADPTRYHWFMGAGMAHGLRLRDGKAEWYRNRFVLSDGIAAQLGRPGIPGPRNGHGDNTANTNILNLGGRTHAIVEAGGLPVELTYELESVARSNLGGTLSHGFTAHPKFDPTTGEMHAITYQPGLQALSYLVVDAAGRARHVADVPAPHGPMVHDIAFTGRFAIILDLPVVFAPQMIAQGGFPFAWNDKLSPLIGLLPRDGDLAGMRWIEAPSCYVFHVMNAFDDGEDVVMDVVRHERTFSTDRQGPLERDPMLARWRIDLATGRLSETLLFDRGCEFPRFNDARGGLSYRYGYTSSVIGGDFGPLHKHDVITGRTLTHDFGAGRSAMEPVFVARAGGTAEDDGYLLTYVHDAGRGAAEVAILDAQDFDGEPLASVQLPVRVPYGFHGAWVAD